MGMNRDRTQWWRDTNTSQEGQPDLYIEGYRYDFLPSAGTIYCVIYGTPYGRRLLRRYEERCSEPEPTRFVGRGSFQKAQKALRLVSETAGPRRSQRQRQDTELAWPRVQMRAFMRDTTTLVIEGRPEVSPFDPDFERKRTARSVVFGNITDLHYAAAMLHAAKAVAELTNSQFEMSPSAVAAFVLIHNPTSEGGAAGERDAIASMEETLASTCNHCHIGIEQGPDGVYVHTDTQKDDCQRSRCVYCHAWGRPCSECNDTHWCNEGSLGFRPGKATPIVQVATQQLLQGS